MGIIGTVLSCVAVSLFWGITNVIIKHLTTEITKVKGKNWFEKFVNEFKYLAVNWNYLLPFFINQIGSISFYFLLIFNELSLVVPVTNSFTFLTTAATSVYFGESVPSIRTILGSMLVTCGISLCVIDKL